MNDLVVTAEPTTGESLPDIIDRARTRLAEARTSAEALEARALADSALHVARLVKAGHEVEADCLLLVTLAERRVGQELIEARASGQIATKGAAPGEDRAHSLKSTATTLTDLGITKDLDPWYCTPGLDDDVYGQALRRARSSLIWDLAWTGALDGATVFDECGELYEQPTRRPLRCAR